MKFDFIKKISNQNTIRATHTYLILGIFLFILIFETRYRSLDHKNFFRSTPIYYLTDSLTCYEHLFLQLHTLHGHYRGHDYLKVKSNNIHMLPFTGYLELENDTIFFSVKQNKKKHPFLIMNGKKRSGWKINYSGNRIDSLTYLGKIADPVHTDSINLFLFTKISCDTIPKLPYVRLLGLAEGGIRYLIFQDDHENVMIQMDHHPKVIFRKKRKNIA